jgi:hypothetical protein
VVQVDGVSLKDIFAIQCSRVHILVESAGVERGVVKVHDGKGNGVRDRWQEVAAPAHKVLGEGNLFVEAKAETMAPASAAKGSAAASASEPGGAGAGVVVIARHRYQGRVGYVKCVS